MKGILDSHFHIMEMEKKHLSVKEVLESCSNEEFSYLLDIGTGLEDFHGRLGYKKYFPNLYFAQALYPSNVEKNWKEMLDTLEEQCSHEWVKAVGEFGIDYHWNFGTPESQKELAAAQISIAKNLNLPIIIHSRNAFEDTHRLLEASGWAERALIHCFSEGPEEAQKYLDIGCTLSFAGPITYKKNIALGEALGFCPSDRFLLETDSPYLSPVPFRGKLNSPLNMIHIFKKAAQLRGVDTEQVVRNVKETFERFFSL
jgi:TatD DNase family protein